MQRPEGIKIATVLIGLIIITSLISRTFRSTELRLREVVLDETSREFLFHDRDQVIHLISHRPAVRSVEEYDARDALARRAHNLGPDEQLLFLEIDTVDSSEFEACGWRITKSCSNRRLVYLHNASPLFTELMSFSLALNLRCTEMTGSDGV